MFKNMLKLCLTNQIGIKKKLVRYDTSQVPFIHQSKEFVIQYKGDYIGITYGITGLTPPKPPIPGTRFYEAKHTYLPKGEDTKDLLLGKLNQVVFGFMYFDCINVSSLIVNGEQLI